MIYLSIKELPYLSPEGLPYPLSAMVSYFNIFDSLFTFQIECGIIQHGIKRAISNTRRSNRPYKPLQRCKRGGHRLVKLSNLKYIHSSCERGE